MTDYGTFLDRKSQLGGEHGFDPLWMPDFLFDFQSILCRWAIRKGRCAIFADCGMGKTLMELVWAENVVRHTNRPVLILTPLAVGPQFVREADKFGVGCHLSRDGTRPPGAMIVVANYERLHYFDRRDFSGVVGDESSCMKDFNGKRRADVTEFMRELPFRLLCTATAAPNDYIELGTSAEALGEMGYVDMLGRFFRSDNGSLNPFRLHVGGRAKAGPRWRLRGHAERDFWRWVCSWARACRKPSDLGCDDGPFVLPELVSREHRVKASRPAPGYLLELPAVTLREQREEARRTLEGRCERVAALVSGTGEPAVAWCHLNPEGKLLGRMISGAVEVSGSDRDEAKEEKLTAFSEGKIRVLVTKPKIAGFGMNWAHCAHQTFFPSHSFEQYYQSVRRSWRFGQTRPVCVDIVATEGGSEVMTNLRRKADACDRMFSRLVELMNDSLTLRRTGYGDIRAEVPRWLQSTN